MFIDLVWLQYTGNSINEIGTDLPNTTYMSVLNPNINILFI